MGKHKTYLGFSQPLPYQSLKKFGEKFFILPSYALKLFEKICSLLHKVNASILLHLKLHK